MSKDKKNKNNKKNEEKVDKNDCFPEIDWKNQTDESLIGVPRWEDLPLKDKLFSIKMRDRENAIRASRLAEKMRERYEYIMPEDMADQLVQYAIAAGAAIGYPEENMNTGLDDCFITVTSPNYKIKEIQKEDGSIELLFEENYHEQNLLTGKWKFVVKEVMRAPCTPKGIRDIVYASFLHVAKVNLDSSITDVMGSIS